MQEHRNLISWFLKIDSGQISHFKPRNAGTWNFYQFDPTNYFWAKFHITCQGMQEHGTFISSIKDIISGQIPHYKPKNAGTSNLYQFAPKY